MTQFLPHQQRVVDEKASLDEKLDKLRAFMALPAFKLLPADDQALLTRQEKPMGEYSKILGERIERFV